MGDSEGTLLRIPSVFLAHDDRRQVGQARFREVDQGLRFSKPKLRAFCCGAIGRFWHIGPGVGLDRRIKELSTDIVELRPDFKDGMRDAQAAWVRYQDVECGLVRQHEGTIARIMTACVRLNSERRGFATY
jgi:hypothetical protein